MTIIATAPAKIFDAEITFVLYSSANGKDYYEIVKNNIPTQTFVEVDGGSDTSSVLKAYNDGVVVG